MDRTGSPLGLVTLVAIGLAGCLRSTVYVCDGHEDCPDGRCEAAGVCSFSDPTCPLGRRFGSFSGPSSERCVESVPTTSCPESYAAIAEVPGHLYRGLSARESWAEQVTRCEDDGAYLAIPDDPTELMALRGLVEEDLWIGISDLDTEGSFVTVLGRAATFLPWRSEEPNNQPTEADCVLASDARSLSDDRCTTRYRAVCECSAL